MKPIDILSSLPSWSKASHEDILSSPAWAMPCRLGDTPCTMRQAKTRPAEVLPLAVRFEDEELILGLADTPAFPELHAVWDSRADVPDAILLALVEKDCGAFLQLLENAVRRQLKIVGLAQVSDASACFEIDGEEPVVFTLDISPSIAEAFGNLRNIDVSHPSVRDAVLEAEAEFAAFALSAEELSSLAAGDAILLPEMETLAPRFIVDGRFSLSENGLAPWKDEGLVQVRADVEGGVTLGAMLDAIDGKIPPMQSVPQENAPLRLVRLGRTVCNGRLAMLAGHHAFSPDA